MTMEKFVLVMMIIMMAAVGAVIVTGSVIGIYWLFSFVL